MLQFWNFLPLVITLESFNSTVEKSISCNLLDVHYLHMLKQKFYLLLENLDHLNNLNIVFVLTLIFRLILISIDCSYKIRFLIFEAIWHCVQLMMLPLEHKVWYQLLQFIISLIYVTRFYKTNCRLS